MKNENSRSLVQKSGKKIFLFLDSLSLQLSWCFLFVCFVVVVASPPQIDVVLPLAWGYWGDEDSRLVWSSAYSICMGQVLRHTPHLPFMDEGWQQLLDGGK